MSLKRFLKPVNDEVLEKHVEKYLVKEVAKQGGHAYKFTSPARRAVPDRLCIFPTGVIVFVEVKRPGKHPTPQQSKEIQKLLDLGALAIYVNSFETVDLLIKQVRTTTNERLLNDSTAGSLIRQ